MKLCANWKKKYLEEKAKLANSKKLEEISAKQIRSKNIAIASLDAELLEKNVSRVELRLRLNKKIAFWRTWSTVATIAFIILSIQVLVRGLGQ